MSEEAEDRRLLSSVQNDERDPEDAGKDRKEQELERSVSPEPAVRTPLGMNPLARMSHSDVVLASINGAGNGDVGDSGEGFPTVRRRKRSNSIGDKGGSILVRSFCCHDIDVRF
jgi:hypothetical protein